jgi:hypothetical protein
MCVDNESMDSECESDNVFDANVNNMACGLDSDDGDIFDISEDELEILTTDMLDPVIFPSMQPQLGSTDSLISSHLMLKKLSEDTSRIYKDIERGNIDCTTSEYIEKYTIQNKSEIQKYKDWMKTKLVSSDISAEQQEWNVIPTDTKVEYLTDALLEENHDWSNREFSVSTEDFPSISSVSKKNTLTL